MVLVSSTSIFSVSQIPFTSIAQPVQLVVAEEVKKNSTNANLTISFRDYDGGFIKLRISGMDLTLTETLYSERITYSLPKGKYLISAEYHNNTFIKTFSLTNDSEVGIYLSYTSDQKGLKIDTSHIVVLPGQRPYVMEVVSISNYGNKSYLGDLSIEIPIGSAIENISGNLQYSNLEFDSKASSIIFKNTVLHPGMETHTAIEYMLSSNDLTKKITLNTSRFIIFVADAYQVTDVSDNLIFDGGFNFRGENYNVFHSTNLSAGDIISIRVSEVLSDDKKDMSGYEEADKSPFRDWLLFSGFILVVIGLTVLIVERKMKKGKKWEFTDDTDKRELDTIKDNDSESEKERDDRGWKI
jgi:hypothetical protein